MNKKIITLLLCIMGFGLFAQTVGAADVPADCKDPAKFKAMSAIEQARCGLDKIGVGTGFGNTTAENAGFYTKFASIVNIVLGLVGILATVYIIYSGITWLRSGGNEQMISEARSGITNAILGLLVVFIAYIIVNFVVTALIAVVKAT